MEEDEIILDKLIHKFLNDHMAKLLSEFISQTKSM